MQSFYNDSVYAIWIWAFLIVNISYDVIHFVFRKVWLCLGVRGP